ncbi:hypothetical protein IAU60_002149 [Kwoniella sp. DSM 27419]
MVKSPLLPSEIATLSAKLFNPSFKARRTVRQPTPPSLAWSKLPPPAAEIDERPRARVRRFRLWKDAVPGLRKVVLDPRKRFHLRRYQSFGIPISARCTGTTTSTRIPGITSLDPSSETVSWITPARAPGSVPCSPAAECGELLERVDENGLLVTPANGSAQPQMRQIVSFLTAPPPSEVASTDRVAIATDTGPVDPAALPVNFTAEAQPAGRNMPSSVPHVTTHARLGPPMHRHPPPWRDKRRSRALRTAAYDQLIEHAWILEREQERRFRLCMGQLMEGQMRWQAANTLPQDQWIRGQEWKKGVDLQDIKEATEAFKAIRKASTASFDYMPVGQLTPVQGIQDVKELISAERQQRKRKQARKAKRAELKQKEAHGEDMRQREEARESLERRKGHRQIEVDRRLVATPSNERSPRSGAYQRESPDSALVRTSEPVLVKRRSTRSRVFDTGASHPSSSESHSHPPVDVDTVVNRRDGLSSGSPSPDLERLVRYMLDTRHHKDSGTAEMIPFVYDGQSSSVPGLSNSSGTTLRTGTEWTDSDVEDRAMPQGERIKGPGEVGLKGEIDETSGQALEDGEILSMGVRYGSLNIDDDTAVRMSAVESDAECHWS